jgi:hypothetical protein
LPLGYVAVREKSERTRVSLDSGGVELVGYLYHAAGNADGDVPCVVMGHGFSGTQDRLFAGAERFAAAGMPAADLRRPELRRVDPDKGGE